MGVIKKSPPKHTNDDLKKMQAWSLEEKIKVSQTRIMEWYLRYDGNVYISFSGGKDSTVLLDLARRVFPAPLSFWTEQDILAYLSLFQISYASVYGEIKKNDKDLFYTTGCDRTGCVFCGFGCHLEKEPNRFQRLKQTHPKLWDYCMRPQKVGGLGMQNVLETIGVEIE